MADSCFDNTMYKERKWLPETSETLQIKQSKASRVSRKSRRASKRHPLEV